MITIDGKRAIELIEQVVRLKGEDYEYPNAKSGLCSYADEYGGPSCIVGYALNIAGVPEEVLPALDSAEIDYIGESGEKPFGTSISELYSTKALRDIASVELTSTAAAAFQEAQKRQDNGKPWVEALTGAKEVVNGLA